MNQGECVDGYGRFLCNCESTTFTGDSCDQPASTLTFNGSQSIDFTLTEPAFSSSEEVSLRFRSRLRNGILFVLKKSVDDPAMTISLEDGRVKCVYDRTKNDKAIYVGDHYQFNNNKWHTVVVRRQGPTVNVEVIDPEKQRYSVQDDLGPDFNTIKYEQVLIGGIRSPSLVQEHPNFIG
jgi:neurexin